MPTGPPRPSRRVVLGGTLTAGMALASGCTSPSARPAGSAATAASRAAVADPDVALVAAARAGEQALVDRLRATLRVHPGLGDVVSTTLAVHRAHLALLVRAVSDAVAPTSTARSPGATDSPGATASPGATSSARPSSGSSPTVPPNRSAALAGLAAAESDLSGAHRERILAAADGRLARALGSLAAAAAQQEVRLQAAAGAGS